MGVSPTYVPVLRTGVDVSFADVVVTGTLAVTGAASLSSTLAVTGNTTLTGLTAAAVTATSVGVTGAAASDCITTRVTADTEPRLALNGDGSLSWGPGNAAADTTLSRSGAGAIETPGFLAMGSGQSSGSFSIFSGASNSLRLGTAGGGLAIAEGANARQGVATLVAGTVAVANTSVTANTRIQLTHATAGGTLGHLSYVLDAGVGFTITSDSATDTSTVTWTLTEPA